MSKQPTTEHGRVLRLLLNEADIRWPDDYTRLAGDVLTPQIIAIEDEARAAAPSVTQRMQDEFNADVRARRAAAPPKSWREASRELHANGDDEPYATDDPSTTLGRAFCPHGVAYDCPSCLAAASPASKHEPHYGNHDGYACGFSGPHCWECHEPWPCRTERGLNREDRA